MSDPFFTYFLVPADRTLCLIGPFATESEAHQFAVVHDGARRRGDHVHAAVSADNALRYKAAAWKC